MSATKDVSQADDWDAHWQNFGRSASENPAQTYRHRILVSLLKRKIGTAPMKLLDLGSGHGDLLVKAVAACPECESAGFELSESGVLLTRQKVPQARVFTVDLFAPPPEVTPLLGWANMAVCSEVLEHVDDPVKFLRASSPYLTTGATLIVTVPRGPMSAFDHHIGHRQHFTRKSIGRVLEAAGFEVEQVFLAGFPFFNLYRALIIARGRRLVQDATSEPGGAPSFFARTAVAVFGFLFRANLLNFPFGWQIIAVARKTGER